MKRAPHPREVIGRKREKCKKTGKCEPDRGTPNWWGDKSHKCKYCDRRLTSANPGKKL